MVGGAIAGAISGIGNSVISGLNYANSEKWNQKNYELQQQALAENKAMNDFQKHFAQNSVQIRAKDLEKAGLSKTLAAGSSAVAPNLQQVGAAQRQYTPLNSAIGSQFLDGIFSSMLNSSQIATSYEEQQNIRADTIKTMQDTAESYERTQGYKYDRDLKELEYNIKNAAKQLYDNLNLPYNFNISNPYSLGLGLALSGGKLFNYLSNENTRNTIKNSNSLLSAPDHKPYDPKEGLNGAGYKAISDALKWLFKSDNHYSVPK